MASRMAARLWTVWTVIFATLIGPAARGADAAIRPASLVLVEFEQDHPDGQKASADFLDVNGIRESGPGIITVRTEYFPVDELNALLMDRAKITSDPLLGEARRRAFEQKTPLAFEKYSPRRADDKDRAIMWFYQIAVDHHEITPRGSASYEIDCTAGASRILSAVNLRQSHPNVEKAQLTEPWHRPSPGSMGAVLTAFACALHSNPSKVRGEGRQDQ